jgi:hypothetical protein
MVAVQKEQKRSTAAQVILLAADDLATVGAQEFTEWELTVAAWKRDPARFGLRGYEQKYPDHKRVMSEIMGSKPTNPVQLRHIEKVRPSTYRLTALGRSEATRLRAGGSPKTARERDPHATLAAYVGHRAFVRWRDDPEQPRMWSEVAEFLSAAPGAPDDDAPAQLDYVRRAIRAGLDYCRSKDVVRLESRGRDPVHVRDIAELSDFLQALQYRFPDEMEGRPARRK